MFKLYLIIASGTIISCLLFYLFNLEENYIVSKPLLLFIRFINVFFHPIAFITPALILMKSHNTQIIKISAYFIFTAILGMQTSYFAALYVAQNSLQKLCKIFLFASIFMTIVLILSAPFLKTFQKKPIASNYFIETKPQKIVLALLIGCVFNTGLRYHYFFIDRHVTEVLVIKGDSTFGYIFFYFTLGISLLFAAYFFKQKNQQKFLSNALAGILLLSIISIILPIYSLINYAIYQIIFAFFLSTFLVPSLSLIFLMFKNSQLIFHGTMWFSTGYALGNLASDWLTEKYGFYTQYNYLPMLPLVFGSSGCLLMLSYLRDRLNVLSDSKTHSNNKSNL